ncbi:monocarboxylate transporter [Nesidiocoris tenuis]|nr:monocarboxylate transporter [Nesidiocoris tenuis]
MNKTPNQPKPRPSTSERSQKPKNLTHTLVTIAPDGGWGWVILVVCMWNCLCVDSVILGFGAIQESILVEFKISAVEVSMLVSVFNFLVYINGPITAALANRFGFSVLNLTGGFLGSLSILSCYWINSFGGMLALYAVFPGIGASMLCMVAMACPGYWFESKRSLAFGITNSSTGITAMAVPALSKLIHDLYGWRWVLVFLASMYFLAFLLGFLIRKPPMMLVEVEETQEFLVKPSATMSVVNVRGAGKRKVDDAILEFSQHNLKHSSKSPYMKSRLSVPSVIFTPESSRFQRCCNKMKCACCKENEIVSVERPMYKSDIFLASRTDFMAKKQNMTQSDYMMSVHRMTTARDIEQQFECLCCPEAITRPLQEMLGVALLKNVVFWFLLVGTLVYYSAIFVTYLYMPRTSERKGLGIKIGLLSLQLFGLTTALTRISLGVVFHFFPQLPPHYFTGAYVVLGGICQLSMSLTTNAIATCTLGALVGFFTGVWLPMRSILIVRYMGLDKLTNAMGMLFVFQAVGGLIGAPAAETLIKFFNEDYVSYYFSGSLFTISGLLIFPLECLNNIITKKGRQN